MKTVNDFIMELQALSEEKRSLPIYTIAENDDDVVPVIRMRRQDLFSGPITAIIITYE